MIKPRLFLILAALLIPVFFVASSTGLPQQPAQQEKPPEQEPSQEPAQEQLEGEIEPEQEKEPAEAAEQPAPAQPRPTGLGFRFSNVPLSTVIETVMQELGYSYVIDPQVQGTASIYTMGEIPRERAFAVLQQLLQMNGQAIIKQEGIYVIVPLNLSTKIPHKLVIQSSGASKKAPKQPGQAPPPPPQEAQPQEPLPPAGQPQDPQPQAGGVPQQIPPPEPAAPQPVLSVVGPPQQPEETEEPAEGVITYIIPLNYIPSGEMVQMISPFVSNGASLINYASGNMILVTDYRRNIEQVLKLVNLLDTQYFDINAVDLVPIRYNQAIDVANDLAQIFFPGAVATGVRIVAIERLNSILVVARTSRAFREVMRWIDKLDVPSAGTNIKTFVYQVENNTATNIAEILAQLYQDGLGLPTGAPEGEGRPAAAQAAALREPGFVSSLGQRFLGGQGELGPTLAGRPMSTPTGIRAVVSGNVKIIVNEFNNSLIIQATEADYQFLLQTIRQLDILPRQVLIEAKIYSVELRDELSFGVSAFLEARSPTITKPDPDDPNNTITVPAGPATTGEFTEKGLSLMTRAFFGRERQLEALINALRTKTNVEVVEAPRLLAVDGMQAQINVGADVPVTTASFGDPIRSGSDTAFINSIQFRPTGTTLLIMPRISASGVVTMDIAIEVSSATGTALTPTINRNFVTTSLIVRDGQTVAIAGIISDQLDSSRSRVPVLGDIPILGILFGRTDRSARRAELVFFITPHVIRNLPTATELTLDFRRALKKAYEFIHEKETEEKELIEKRRKKELEQGSQEPGEQNQ